MSVAGNNAVIMGYIRLGDMDRDLEKQLTTNWDDDPRFELELEEELLNWLCSSLLLKIINVPKASEGYLIPYLG
ncbi:hypothetical protein [Paenibacillus pabuli]|uniref:hypothetical protein n=1 Tax=Paenibacillus pabuli TaxID=1472 RepID=UPI001FFFCCA2|nr:hypothetical protein [Paenibacillus pabuli]UPK45467.1 hypothetical protein KET34_08385 [Paenibacillus pabuli]